MHLKQKSYDEDQDSRVEICERLMPILEDENNYDLVFFFQTKLISIFLG